MFWSFGKSKKTLTKGLALSLSKGFTLLELIVVIAIFLIITAVVMTDIPNFREKSSLDLTVSEVATYIRGAQVYGAAQKGGAQGVTTYSINFTKNSSEFSLTNDKGFSEENYKINGFKIDPISVIDSVISSCDSDVNNMTIIFKVNDYSSGIGTQLEPKIEADGADCDNFSYVKISIVSIRNPLSRQCLLVYRNGQITPASCT